MVNINNGDYITNKGIYNFFLFMSTLTRGLVEVFSVIFLYNLGYSINNILLFLLIMYISGILVNYCSLVVNTKIVLIISSILYGISYLYLSIMNNSIFNLILFAILLSFSSYSYHVIRHYLAMKMVDYDKGKNINVILIVMYGAVILSNLVGIVLVNKLSIMINSVIIMFLSIISIIPILKLDNIQDKKITFKNIKITKDKITFSILEQFKVILMEIQPLFVYLYINKSMYYVGIFNVVINLASLIVMLFITKKIKKHHFKYTNLLLCLVLILKLNMKGSIMLLFIALFEGIGMKIYEKFSLDNLYDLDKNQVNSYLLLEEFIFFGSKSFIMSIFFFVIKDIKIILYICIIGIFISSFYIKD